VNGDEFDIGHRHPLGLQEQIAEILIAAATISSAAPLHQRFLSRFSPLRRRGSLLAGVPGTPTGVGWKSVAGFQKLSENNA
jgi:hypothetical protein